ncbi:YggS family pyridoxal phosphate-dependent enzyme [Rathayibacter sp. AY1E9]|uniref:YggS family pyridoxal phosphate-dependent enzyme n=1 Tax=unclassified Rathayibacter TaxID=2609250 RepID=UPI000CE84825|nr:MULTISPECIES: YggS family pyridoxal phosphate-dependent enzyme [unclassified Rathayibacter]PPF11842.1 YggS family pyridoxal phosphate-dependent enzyme [Rathayibacter sp. AY1A5]PPF35854.1 YggS family pyridoxal phosphate-dependent enzyme [Rathayibacter sp. AY1A2]PPF50218.1 YggS family pyridoxal phosphate-dependent enzyme [Rathayibacter sp. AY1A1]PPG13370.1 YggS family pyridoxal phosphate-dependent enzyme [Rathayibacter sp. AY1E8]PPG15918.1 YggS family pyridoxal phosphate-dependent enzyme [Rat
MPDPELAARWAEVSERVADATRSAGREASSVTTIVVTKFHPVSLLRDLLELGVVDFGENRHQEAQEKSAELAGTAARWHFIGQLQSKKARQVRRYADAVHSVDRLALVPLLEAGEEPLDVFLQVNLTEDPDRGGASPADVEPLAEALAGAPGLTLRGVMAVAPLDEEPRPAFARLRSISDRVRAVEPSATAISAGMSNDFAEAIAEGATHLRIGSAITGERPART